SFEDMMRAANTRAEGTGTGGESAVGGDDLERRWILVGGDVVDDAVIGGVGAGAAGVEDFDVVARAFGEVSEGAAAYDDGDGGGVIVRRVVDETRDEGPDSRAAIAPPSVGAGADDVHDVDDDVAGRRACHEGFGLASCLVRASGSR